MLHSVVAARLVSLLAYPMTVSGPRDAEPDGCAGELLKGWRPTNDVRAWVGGAREEELDILARARPLTMALLVLLILLAGFVLVCLFSINFHWFLARLIDRSSRIPIGSEGGSLRPSYATVSRNRLRRLRAHAACHAVAVLLLTVGATIFIILGVCRCP